MISLELRAYDLKQICSASNFILNGNPLRVRQQHSALGNFIYSLESGQMFVRSEVFTAVTMKNAIFWDVTPCRSSKYRRLKEHIASIIRMTRIGELGTMLAVTSILARRFWST
jgi:hypothetical protein